MRLLTTCLRWELAEQPPILQNNIRSISSDGPYLVITYNDDHTEHVLDEHDKIFRVLS